MQGKTVGLVLALAASSVGGATAASAATRDQADRIELTLRGAPTQTIDACGERRAATVAERGRRIVALVVERDRARSTGPPASGRLVVERCERERWRAAASYRFGGSRPSGRARTHRLPVDTAQAGDYRLRAGARRHRTHATRSGEVYLRVEPGTSKSRSHDAPAPSSYDASVTMTLHFRAGVALTYSLCLVCPGVDYVALGKVSTAPDCMERRHVELYRIESGRPKLVGRDLTFGAGEFYFRPPPPYLGDYYVTVLEHGSCRSATSAVVNSPRDVDSGVYLPGDVVVPPDQPA